MVLLVVNPLTGKRGSMWESRRSGVTLETIGRRFGVTRQAVCRALHISGKKIGKTFNELAETYKILPEKIDTRRGFLKGYSQVLGSDILLVYSSDQGIQLWYKSSGKCGKCRLADSCRDSLLMHAERLGVDFSEKEAAMLPARFAQVVFERAWPEMSTEGRD